MEILEKNKNKTNNKKQLIQTLTIRKKMPRYKAIEIVMMKSKTAGFILYIEKINDFKCHA